MVLARKGWDHETIVRTMLSWANEAAEAAWAWAQEEERRTAVVKVCGCGREYTEHEWRLLAVVGEMRDEVEAIELRNCAECGSTISQPLKEEP